MATKPRAGDGEAEVPAAERPVISLPTLGDASAAKLRLIGITNLAALAGASPVTVRDACGNELETARRWVEAARVELEEDGFLEKSTMSALEMWKREKAAPRLALGTPRLDEFFRGGLRGGQVYELYGEAGNGKSQLCFQATVMALKKAGGKVVYIESENAFKPGRVAQIAEARGVGAEGALSRIEVKSPLNHSEQAHHVSSLRARPASEGIRLVVVDSFTSMVRTEMPGRAFMSERSAWIMQNIGVLKSFARLHNIPVIITNQITTDMDVMFGDNKVAFGGTGLAHATSYRVKIYVPKNSKKRVFKMIDSPEDPEIETLLWVDDGGYTGEDPGAGKGGKRKA